MRRAALAVALAAAVAVGAANVVAEDLPPPESVQDLMATYAWFTDRHDAQGMRTLFLEDATLVSPRTDTTVNGVDEIMNLLTNAWGQQPENERKRRHLIAGIRGYDESGNQVKFFATFGVVGTPDGEPSKAFNSGYYQGIAEKTDSGMKFRRLVIGVD